MHRAHPFRMSSFEEEAKTILEQARVRAKEIAREALEEAKKVRDQAYQEGFRKGLQEGSVRAAAEEKKRVAEETSGLAGLLGRIAEGIEERRRGLEAGAERDLVRLAVAVAERIVKRELHKGVPVAWENLKHAVALTAHRRSLEVRLHPEDLPLLEKYVAELRSRFAEIADIQLRGEGSIGRGGCIVVTREGAVDARVETQLEEIERQLLS